LPRFFFFAPPPPPHKPTDRQTAVVSHRESASVSTGHWVVRPHGAVVAQGPRVRCPTTPGASALAVTLVGRGRRQEAGSAGYHAPLGPLQVAVFTHLLPLRPQVDGALMMRRAVQAPAHPEVGLQAHVHLSSQPSQAVQGRLSKSLSSEGSGTHSWPSRTCSPKPLGFTPHCSHSRALTSTAPACPFAHCEHHRGLPRRRLLSASPSSTPPPLPVPVLRDAPAEASRMPQAGHLTWQSSHLPYCFGTAPGCLLAHALHHVAGSPAAGAHAGARSRQSAHLLAFSSTVGSGCFWEQLRHQRDLRSAAVPRVARFSPHTSHSLRLACTRSTAPGTDFAHTLHQRMAC
jgi:hypothetical protein